MWYASPLLGYGGGRNWGGAREDLLRSGMAMLPPRFQSVAHLLAMVSLCFLSRASSLAMEMEEGHGDGSDSIFLGSSNSNVPALFLFGDSIADTGNNNWLFTLARADFPPYGRSFVDHVPTGRFSDGPLAIDYLGKTKKHCKVIDDDDDDDDDASAFSSTVA
jgi:hypothetical protein